MFPSVWQQLSLTSSAQGQSESQAVSRDALGPDNPLPMSLHFSSGCPGILLLDLVISGTEANEDWARASGLHIQKLRNPG